jgi:hypothetical protein
MCLAKKKGVEVVQLVVWNDIQQTTHDQGNKAKAHHSKRTNQL